MSLRHVRHLPAQVPVVVALGRALLPSRTALAREVVETIAPPHPALVRDYVELVGGDPATYRSTVPPHLFPHWCVPLAARALAGTPYPLSRIVNAGCALDVRAPLPARAPLVARASVIHIDDDGRRAIITQRMVTGTSSVPDAVVATVTTIVPLAKRTKSSTSSTAKQRITVPYDADELARWSFARDAGLAFAVLTGDFNPIHWLTRAGVAAGFGGPILHGFAMLARAYEGTVRARFAGDASRVRVWDAKFTRPLTLPADVGLFTRGNDVWLADTRGTAPYLAMTVEEASR